LKQLLRVFLILLLVIITNNLQLTPSSQINTEDKLVQKLKEYPDFKSSSIQESEELAINNASWIDYPFDNDDNGLYDYLVIANISFSNIDQIYYLLRVLKSTNGQCLGFYKETITPYDTSISLSFDGQPINASGINGHYEVWISISTNPYFHDADLVLVYVTSQSYNVNDFEEASVVIVGFSDAGYDIDGDTLFEGITLEVTLRVQQAGYYRLILILESDNPYSLETSNIKGYWHGYLDASLETVQIKISAISFYSTKLNGPFSVDIAYIKHHHFIVNAYNTSFYNFNQFGLPSLYLTGTYDDRGQDTDTDGFFNELIIEPEINVTLNGTYYIRLWLNTINGENSFDRIVERDFEVGIHTVSISFDVSSLFSQRLNTSYWVESIRIQNWESETILWVYSPHITRVYNYTEFDPPVAYTIGVLNDWAQDTDGDGLFNQLILDVKINVIVAGFYRIRIVLESTLEDYSYSYLGEVEDDFSLGIHILAIPIDIRSYEYRLNTSYELQADYHTNIWIYWGLGQNNVIDNAYLSYITRIYNYTEFDGPGALLTGNYYDRGLDMDGDGRYDKLIIDVEVNFTTPGDYQIDLEVVSYARKDISIDGSIYGYWEMGVRNVSILIDTSLFYATLTNSVYTVENVTVYDSKDYCLEWVDLPYTTRVYNFTEFNIRFIYIDGNSKFSKLIKAEKWEGDGSRSNPYVINGLSLKGQSSSFSIPPGLEGSLIQILNTNVYFSITNCSFLGVSTGIYLSNVTNGNISHNIIQDNEAGIVLQFSDNNTIAYNTINRNSMGLLLGTQSSVKPNPAHCSNNSIINNVIFENDLFGLSIGVKSKNNVVKWNDFRSNDVNDHNSENIFVENYWYEWAENESTDIPLVGNHDINPQTSPNHLSKPVVLFPNWGETLISKVLIDWIPAKDSLGHSVIYTIYYSSDNGTTWNLLASELTITNYQWEFHNISLGSLYLIKIIAFDSLGFFSMDISDQLFTIRSPPQPPSTLPFRFVVLLLLFSFLLILLKRKS
jgi:parallel beta-helix repeat protein